MNKPNPNIPTKVKDHLVTGETFELIYDLEREMLITSPKPAPENLSKYYESEDYISHTDNNKGIVSYLYQTVKKRAIEKKAALINSLNNGAGTLLDIGAGTGDFLKQAKEANWKVSGVEPNEGAKKLAQEKGINLQETINDFNGKTFDVITMWHVLEHVPNLEETILTIEKLLKPNGTLIIAVPNYKSFDANHYKEHWAAYDVPRHLWHFSQTSMRKIFSENLQLVKTKPMIFDSFYVSLLSEKNKTGKQNLIKAFFVGLRSNISAYNTKEHSSLIYCFKKVK
ncbi:MAG: methyltransferase [Flavobacterium sp.]|nr:MAG: methyltransferase [Flavobacterium sp.]